MRPPGVIPRERLSEVPLGLSKIRKLMLPHAFFFETAKKALDDAILLRGVRCDEFLGQVIFPTGGAKASALKDEAIITPDNGEGPLGPECAKSPQAAGF